MALIFFGLLVSFGVWLRGAHLVAVVGGLFFVATAIFLATPIFEHEKAAYSEDSHSEDFEDWTEDDFD